MGELEGGKALQVQIIIFVLPNVVGKLCLNFLKIPKESHPGGLRARRQVITGVAWTQDFLVWGEKCKAP